MGVTWKTIPNGIESSADFDASLDHDFKEMGDFVIADHNNQDKTKFPIEWQSLEYLTNFWQTARGLLQYWKIQALHGGTGPASTLDRDFPGESWDNSYSFEFTASQKKDILKHLGCEADRDKMCKSYGGNRAAGRFGHDVEYTLFNLALCTEYYRDQEGGTEPFEWGAHGLRINDRYGFTDLQDFSGTGGDPFKAVAIGLVGALSTPIGAINNWTLQRRADSFWNLVRKAEHTNENDDPYMSWRSPGNELDISSLSKDANGMVTVTTSTPHGLNTIGGDGGDGIRLDSGSVNGWEDKTGVRDAGNNNRWTFPNGVNVTVVDANTFKYGPYPNSDGSTPSVDANFISSNNMKMYQMKRWGIMRNMYTRDVFSIGDLAQYNPILLFDAVKRGHISFNDLPSSIAQGNAASNPTAEGFAGGPHAPDKQNLPSLVNNWTTGASGNYPKPWMSASQKITNSNYTWVGAFARLLGPHKDAYTADPTLRSCDIETWDGKDDRSIWNDAGEYGIYGRIGKIQSGDYANQWGFFPQKWYDQDQGTYDGAFWSARFDPPLADTLVWKDPDKWWDSIPKKTIKVYYLDMAMNVEVAMSNPDFADDDYFKGQDLGDKADLSLDVTMLSVMVATAALTRWL